MADEGAHRIDWVPANGLNLEDPAIRVRPDEATESLNMLYERNVARTRPYATRDTYSFWPNPSPNKFRFARGMLVGADNPNSVVILSNGTLAKGPQAQALTQSGGGTLALGAAEFDNINVVNGVFVIGNNGSAGTNGMVRHDPSTSLFTIVTTANFRYYTGMYSRAVGGYKGTATLETAHTVGWSVAGDETDWAGAGSGETVLAETPDEITGVNSLQNILVVLRSMGLTVGFPTGVGTAPIRFETLVRHGPEGCPYPSTIANHGSRIFYWGHDDCYHLDLNLNPQPIGRNIRREVLRWLARGVLFRGFATRMDFGIPAGGQVFIGADEQVDPVPRLRYHLVPIQRPGVPHYSYDAEAKTWSRHIYSLPLLGGLEGFNLASSSVNSAITWNTTLLIDEATQDILRWTENASGAGEIADEESSIASGIFVVGEPEMEYKCQRAFITWTRDGFHGVGEVDPPAFKMRVECKQQQRPTAKEALVNLFQVSEGYEDWQGTWVDLKLTGQFFRIRLAIPSTLRIQIAQVSLFLSEGQPTKASNYTQS